MNRNANVITPAINTKEDDDSTEHSVVILIAFFFLILALFSLGVGCSYLYYRHASNKRKAREEEEQREMMARRQQQIRYRALATAQCFRGVPNCYSPNPKEESPLLMDIMNMSVIPVQIQQNDSNH